MSKEQELHAESENGMAANNNYGNMLQADTMTVTAESPKTYLCMLEERIDEERKNNICIDQIIDKLNNFIENISDEQLDLEAKLNLANRNKELQLALKLKEKISKEIEKNASWLSANKYFAFILSLIVNRFEAYVYPVIQEDKSNFEVNRIILEQVVIPVFDEIQKGRNYFDFDYHDVRGMIYFLAGSCHIWFDKANTQC